MIDTPRSKYQYSIGVAFDALSARSEDAIELFDEWKNTVFLCYNERMLISCKELVKLCMGILY